MKKGTRIVFILVGLIAGWMLLFVGARYGWRLFGFYAGDNCRVESVVVTDNYAEIKGEAPELFPGSFVGYYEKEKDGKLYVCFKFNQSLGVLPEETGSAYAKIRLEASVTEVYYKNGSGEYLIWSKPTEEISEEVSEKPEKVELPEGLPEESEKAELPEGLPENQEKVELPEAYRTLLDTYAIGIKEQWDTSKLMENGLNFMVAFAHEGKPLEEIGYYVEDINQDGVSELFIGSLLSNEYYGKMIFSFYTLDEEKQLLSIFDGIERNCYYYAGGIKFANLGASAFDATFVTTVKFEDNELIDMTYTTEPSEYVQLPLIPFAEW